MDATKAILFTLYMVPVNLLDNILRPLVAKGLATPMPVILIGVLGGTLVHGMIGLFVGPIVLSIAWQLIVVWTREPGRMMLRSYRGTAARGCPSWQLRL